MESAETWTVGREYDQDLLDRLRRLLYSLGYSIEDKWQGVGGSQDILHCKYVRPCGSLVLESETYLGLTVSGPAKLVEEVKEAFTSQNS